MAEQCPTHFQGHRCLLWTDHKLGHDFGVRWINELWERRFGTSIEKANKAMHTGFLELTRRKDGRAMYIRPSAIESYEPINYDPDSSIVYSQGRRLLVQESVAVIKDRIARALDPTTIS